MQPNRRPRPFLELDGPGALAPHRILSPATALRVRAFLTAYWTANLVLVAITVAGFFVSDAGYDWLIYVEAGERLGHGTLYDWEGIYAWSYSPLLAAAFAVLAPLGYAGWSLLHVAALSGLRDRWLMAITFTSWPFWADVYNGNTMTFVFVAAVATLRGSTIGTGSYLLLSLLMPRPLMLPLVLWVLWRMPAWRLRFAAMVVIVMVLVFATGYAGAWMDVLIGVPEAVAATSRDVGPSAVMGGWWLPIGGLLALVLLARQRIGWASLAASPYWLPQYLLMLLLELVRPGADGPRQRG